MIGIGGWRGRTDKAGPLWFVKDGKLTSDTAPGTAGSHGQRLPFGSPSAMPNHPITKGLPGGMDASGRRAVREAARPWPQHDRAGHGVFRSREQRHAGATSRS